MKGILYDKNNSHYFKRPERKMDFHWWENQTTSAHYHNYYEIIVTTEGTITHVIEDKKRRIGPGVLTIIAPNISHQIISSEEKRKKDRHFNISFFPEVFERLCNNVSPFLFSQLNNTGHFEVQLSKKEFDILNEMTSYIITKTTDPQIIDDALLLTLANFILTIVEVSPRLPDSVPQWFKELLVKINGEELFLGYNKVSDVYKLASYSPSYVVKAFKKYMNCTVIEYLTELRVQYACVLLKQTNYTTLYISSKLGYDSLSNFNRVFKKQTGKNPSQYRKDVNK